MKKIIILCAGDFGKELLWLIEDINAKHPTYDILGFLDDDDEWLPSKVEKQVAYLESKPGYDVVSCNRFILLDNGKKHVVPQKRFTKQGDVSNEIWC